MTPPEKDLLDWGPSAFERLAKSRGYDCTLKEVAAAFGSVELDDALLKHIIGGDPR